MALTKVSRGLLSTGIVDNSNATANFSPLSFRQFRSKAKEQLNLKSYNWYDYVL